MKWLTHFCAATTFAFVARAAKFGPSWFEIPLLARAPQEPLPTVSIVVPARNEERSIERCVRSLATQRYLSADVIVLDDRSTDATPQILERLAAEFPNVRVVPGEELPDGWVGKPWALHQAQRVARGEWLLFTDADSDHAPAGVASALAFTLGARADALSIGSRQELGTFWERATLPFILGLIFYAVGPLEQINDPLQPERALANGQYILVERTAYDALGGHEALRAEIVEDVQFARRLKADGRFRFVLAGGTRLASVRMYHALPEIWAGFTKNVFMGAEGNVPVLLAGAAFMFVLSAPSLLTVWAIARRKPYEALEAAAATLAAMLTWWRGIAMVGMPPAAALLQPLGTAFFGAVMLNSTYRVLSGRGVEWRGRRYSGRPTAATNTNGAP
jgi:chlorobactene glucosyltransferase